jgi:hypothetical protein
VTPQPSSADLEIDLTDVPAGPIDDIVSRMSPVGKQAIVRLAEEGPQPSAAMQSAMRHGLLARSLIRPEVDLGEHEDDASVTFVLTELGEQVAAALTGSR